uniref:inhibitor of growth protein 4 isoform X1 n=1 Tax=Ciona intestinalis TaxID=7719 RepID=UPI000EF520C6|nr:inhibitor of growth protein 4 isoform X1 [Ciona intestinalis]|eukprot:XP_026693890.1 inhibitor of growth protein 4 isoform X1 [Ciona intestinalis]
MATAMYLEQYLDSLENLPFELQRNFQLMRQLDQRSEDIKVEIDGRTEGYVREAKSLSPPQRVKKIKEIQERYLKCREFADDKVQLAMQTYEMVDKHIRRLDSDLARFEADLKEKSIQDATGTSKGDCDVTIGDKKRKKKGRATSEDESKNGRKKQKTVVLVPGVIEMMTSPLAAAYQSSDVLDMPVDPNEPTYCLCHQVSYGEMIGCDNQDCPIEWFHFGCVGLQTKPKGKWFCPKCKDRDRKKK